MILVPDVGEVAALNRFLDRVAVQDMTLALFKSTNTPTEGDIFGSYTKCDFAGYVDKLLDKSLWNAPATVTGTTSSAYPPQSWTCNGAGNTVYGSLYIDGDLTTLLASDLFATPRVIANTDTLSFTPRWEAQ